MIKNQFFIYGILKNNKHIYVTKDGLISPLFEHAVIFNTEQEAKQHLEQYKFELDCFNNWKIDSMIS